MRLLRSAAIALVLAMITTASSAQPPETRRGTPRRAEAPPAGTVVCRGLVTNLAGRPLGDVRVRSDVRRYFPPGAYVIGEAETKTDASGRFELGPLPAESEQGPDVRMLIFEHPDYAMGWVLPSPRGDADPANVRIKLAAPAVIGGKITDQAGKPIAGATVEADVQFFYGHIILDRASGMAVSTDPEGRFLFRHVPEGARLHLHVKHRQYASYSTRDEYRQDTFPVRAGDENVQITLDPGGAITGRLVMAGQPYEKKDVLVSASGSAGSGWTVTDEEGRFELTGLRAGSYTVLAKETPPFVLPDFVCAPKANVEVKAGPVAAAIELEFSEGQVLTGRVLDERTSKPLRLSVKAYLAGDARELFDRASPGDDGRYYMRLPSGQYEVTAAFTRSGKPYEAKANVSVEVGKPLEEVDLILPFSLELEAD